MAEPGRRLVLGGAAALGSALALGGTAAAGRAVAADDAGPPPRPLALTHATLVAAPGVEPPQPGMTIVIRAGRIAAVGRSAELPAPPDARLMDLRGKYVIPGLIDSRTDGDSSDFPPVRRGVTTFAGPAGAPLDGAPALRPESVAVRDAATARQAVLRAADGGAAFVRVHPRLSREAYLAVADEAGRRQLPYAGHCPDAVPLAEASDAGQRIVEHLHALLPAASTREEEIRRSLARIAVGADPYRDWLRQIHRLEWTAVRSYYPDRADRLLDRLAANGTRITPALAAHGDPRGADAAYLRGIHEHRLHLVAELHRRGVPVLAGSAQGRDLHDELEQLADGAGLGAAAALRAATVEPARALGLAGTAGTVAPGRAADLVVLAPGADPLRDVKAVRRIDAVVVRGRLFESGPTRTASRCPPR
ncbi:amidohydrolase family protein [Streptomyces roseoverticillatus]|uniref:amidohydrolase family protein n=1 Tax=Streptomyces roseoverticillatus TaxID=66429 RepID=UPI001F1A7C48|nr:amidohydrolase family protein [Streptomyces roseoverticillatus]MCF3106737.1 amidohydrolase family protein [Streptomyces roseoverticillatus]